MGVSETTLARSADRKLRDPNTAADKVPHYRAFDGTGGLAVYMALVFFIPARWVVPGLGAAGRPANLFAIGLLCLWLVVKALPMFEHRRTLMRWPLLINIVVLLTSQAMGFDRGLSSVEALSSDRALLKLAGFTGLVLVASEGIPTIESLNKLIRRIAYFSTTIAFIGVIQFVTKFDPYSVIRFPGLVLNRDIADLNERGLASLVRVKGSFGHPIEFGVTMGMMLPIVIHLALHAKTDRERMRWLAITALHAGASTLTVSRSAIVALVAGLGTLIWTWSPRYKIRALVIGVIFTVALRIAVPGLLGTIRAIFVYWRVDPSIQNRTSDYDIAWAYVAERPWFGRGVGTFIPGEYILLDNAFLGRIVATGWVGFGSLLLIFVSAALAGYVTVRTFPSNQIRHLAAALTAIIVVGFASCATFDLFFFPTATSVMTLAFGITAALAVSHSPLRLHPEDSSPAELLRPAYRRDYKRPTWRQRIEGWQRAVSSA